jgi:hypothetical protein
MLMICHRLNPTIPGELIRRNSRPNICDRETAQSFPGHRPSPHCQLPRPILTAAALRPSSSPHRSCALQPSFSHHRFGKLYSHATRPPPPPLSDAQSPRAPALDAAGPPPSTAWRTVQAPRPGCT